jgi:ubiquinone/menaquinone biosynthesis C-methylase UbiE
MSAARQAHTRLGWPIRVTTCVHLVDLSARLVEEARKRNATLPRPIASLSVADARSLPQPDGSATAVLELGPLYHLPERTDRLAALREAFRVLAASGILVAAIAGP